MGGILKMIICALITLGCLIFAVQKNVEYDEDNGWITLAIIFTILTLICKVC